MTCIQFRIILIHRSAHVYVQYLINVGAKLSRTMASSHRRGSTTALSERSEISQPKVSGPRKLRIVGTACVKNVFPENRENVEFILLHGCFSENRSNGNSVNFVFNFSKTISVTFFLSFLIICFMLKFIPRYVHRYPL